MIDFVLQNLETSIFVVYIAVMFLAGVFIGVHDELTEDRYKKIIKDNEDLFVWAACVGLWPIAFIAAIIAAIFLGTIKGISSIIKILMRHKNKETLNSHGVAYIIRAILGVKKNDSSI